MEVSKMLRDKTLKLWICDMPWELERTVNYLVAQACYKDELTLKARDGLCGHSCLIRSYSERWGKRAGKDDFYASNSSPIFPFDRHSPPWGINVPSSSSKANMAASGIIFTFFVVCRFTNKPILFIIAYFAGNCSSLLAFPKSILSLLAWRASVILASENSLFNILMLVLFFLYSFTSSNRKKKY